jgi:acetylornithine deacetylase/succinyl-diaminopimelate desuccinylase-like protein
MIASDRPASNQSMLRRRPVVALALLGIFVAILSPTAPARALWPFDVFFSEPSLEERAVQLLSDAIRIPTVNPPGNEARLARRFVAELGRAGIENRLIVTPSDESGSTRAAVWGRLRGKGDRPGIALLSHLDTVPADPRDWSVDPFAGRIWDGFVWGRGALDSKSVSVTHLMTLLELAASDERLERDIVFLATPDEETGGLQGAGWIVSKHPELLDGVGYLLTEGGGIQTATQVDSERPEVWGISVTEKAPCWLELRSHGRAGHSSAPTPEAAVPRLIEALDRIRRVESPVRVVDEVAEMFTRLSPLAPEWERAGLLDLAAALEHDEAFRRRFLGDPGQNALVRNTISITVLEGAPKTNVAPSMARAELDARLLPGERCEDFADSLQQLIAQPSIDVEEILSFPARASSIETPLFQAIEDVAADRPGGAAVVPRMIGGFTDAHWFRESGIVAYGFVPRALAGEEAGRVHGVDERVSIETLAESIELSIKIVRRLDEIDR